MPKFTVTCPQPLRTATVGETLRQVAPLSWLYPRFLGRLFFQVGKAFGPRLGSVWRPLRQIKLVKRYLRGAHLGWLLARYLLRENSPLPSRGYPLYADFFGSWGVAIIASDYVLDSHMAAPGAAQRFLEDFLRIMQGREVRWEAALTAAAGDKPLNPGRDARSLEAEFLALGLGRLVKQNLERLRRAWPDRPHWRVAWQHNEEEWLNRTRELLKGQLKSLEQFYLSEAHNWKWYYEEVLNQKTINFFFAPIPLYCLTSTALKKYEILKYSFLLLNSTYFHWQLIDDIADLIDDTREGMVTSPGYLLISQGQLASELQKYFDLDNNDIYTDRLHHIVDHKIINPILESGLLIEEFCSPTLWHELLAHRDRKTRNEGGEAPVTLARRWVRRALANLPPEEGLSLPELCARKAAQKENYLKAMANGEAEAAVALVLESGAAQRLLSVAQDAERVARLSAGLRLIDDPALLAILRAVQRLLQRACQRAVHLLEGFPSQGV